MKNIIRLILFLLVPMESFAAYQASVYNKIGNLIWRNECAQSHEKLTWWNKDEEFASLGIGHFIWYPAQEKNIFSQTFPDLLNYLHRNGTTLPAWLGRAPALAACPWHNREEFFDAFNSEQMLELRTLLSSTIDLQTQFIVMRTQKKLKSLIARNITKNTSHLRLLIKQLQQSPRGFYALIDYINFKGEGTSAQERYNGQGWGLLQVLESIGKVDKHDTKIVEKFADAAKKLIIQRVKNSPPARNEQKFLAGWLNRINTYTQPL